MKHQHDGGALPAATVLGYIQAAEAQGALDLPVTVGSYEGAWGMAEFGSTDSSFRLMGAIERTPIALSVTVNELDSGHAYIMVHAILSHSIEILGYEGKEIQATLYYFKDKNTLEVALQSGHYSDEVTETSIFRTHLEMTANFDLSSPTLRSWGEVEFELRPNHVVSSYRNDGSILPRKQPCNNLLALTTSATTTTDK